MRAGNNMVKATICLGHAKVSLLMLMYIASGRFLYYHISKHTQCILYCQMTKYNNNRPEIKVGGLWIQKPLI